ncbi:MAG: hypothetical protein D6775_08145 [Caldilineae bacterium]|nr:MAG: hypothetical protein D6775_08145 [Caldilineae bacterium]
MLRGWREWGAGLLIGLIGSGVHQCSRDYGLDLGADLCELAFSVVALAIWILLTARKRPR